MYIFTDTTAASAGTVLPIEALQINGKYIEELIPGYRTLSVSGREALSAELSVYETGVRDGSSVKNKRYPAREIIVKYQLIAKTANEFREKYNILAGILNVEEATLIFNDETDKFYSSLDCFLLSLSSCLLEVYLAARVGCFIDFTYSAEIIFGYSTP